MIVRRRDQRLDLIRELVRRNEVSSQEELQALLEAEGVRTTQATLSRDLRDAGIRKEAGIYRVAVAARAERPRRLDLLRAVAGDIASVSRGGTVVVVLTAPGRGPTVAQAVRDSGFAEVLGAVADAATVLVATGTAAQARSVERAVRRVLPRSN